MRTEVKPQAKQEVTPDRCQAGEGTLGAWLFCSVKVEPPSLGLPTFRPNGTDVELPASHTTVLWLQSAGARLHDTLAISCHAFVRQVVETQHWPWPVRSFCRRTPGRAVSLPVGLVFFRSLLCGSTFVRLARCLLQNVPLLRNLRALPSKASCRCFQDMTSLDSALRFCLVEAKAWLLAASSADIFLKIAYERRCEERAARGACLSDAWLASWVRSLGAPIEQYCRTLGVVKSSKACSATFLPCSSSFGKKLHLHKQPLKWSISITVAYCSCCSCCIYDGGRLSGQSGDRPRWPRGHVRAAVTVVENGGRTLLLQ